MTTEQERRQARAQLASLEQTLAAGRLDPVALARVVAERDRLRLIAEGEGDEPANPPSPSRVMCAATSRPPWVGRRRSLTDRKGLGRLRWQKPSVRSVRAQRSEEQAP